MRRNLQCIGVVIALVLCGCGRDARPTSPRSLIAYDSRAIGNPATEPPWITHVAVADLDQDGLMEIVVCDARSNQVSSLSRRTGGEYVEVVLGQTVAGPAHVSVADVDGDGDLDLLVASMGVVAPSNARSGAVVVLENLGHGRYQNRVLLQDTFRVTDVEAADIDGDGDQDLIVGQFGYLEGQIQVLENLGNWSYQARPLLDLAGTIHSPIGDLNGDGRPDIVALVSQDWEEVHGFFNQGQGKFDARILFGSTNKDYGSSGLSLVDLDRDGDLDVLYSNGDGFDYATPGSRPWHGLQWLENDGNAKFTFHRIGALAGAYSLVAADLDGDGDVDVVASSGFNDWSRSDAVSLAWFENDGRMNFKRHDLAQRPTHLVTVAAADLDGDGDIELVAGGFCFYPPFDRSQRLTLWKRRR